MNPGRIIPNGRTLLAVLCGLAVVPSLAQTVTVTTLHDVSDFPAPRRVENLPGPDGRVSMQEAMAAVNNTPGPQTVEFAIPTAEFWLIQGVALLELDSGPYVLTDNATTIDFSSQTRNIGDTNPNGPEVGIYGLQPNGWGAPAIIVQASNCVIRGLGMVYQRGSAVSIWNGNDNRIVGCNSSSMIIEGTFGGPPVLRNIVGGTEPGDGNILTTVEILCWANDSVVIGNQLRHVRVEGSQYCVFPTNNRIGGPTPAERNVIAGWGSYGEEGYPNGSMVDVVWAQDTLVEGNYIGTTPDGMARQQQIGTGGVSVRDSNNTIVRNNLIAGLRTMGANHYAGQLFGVAISVGATNRDNLGTVIEGNVIGLAADGVTPIPTLNGIVVAPMIARYHTRQTRIGGLLPEQGNEIAAVERLGIMVHALESGVTISGNSIHDCGGLGIDLALNSGVDGPTPNDPLDADTAGGNRLQNHPVLSSAQARATAIDITGALSSAAGRSYRVEFFASPACDPSGYGEGERFLGATEVTTSAAGAAPFDVSLALANPIAGVLTATATDLATGDTSEFSACIAIAAVQLLYGDLNCDGARNNFDIDPFVLALTDPAAYSAAFPGCDVQAADLNGDGLVNNFDIDPFVLCLAQGVCP